MTARGIAFLAAFTLVAVFLSAPIWESIRLQYSSWQDERANEWFQREVERNRERNRQPAPQLPERPEDRKRYPRETFAVRYVNDDGFAIDTARGMVNYDRVADPDTMIALRLSDAQLDTLYEEALENRLFEMREPRPLGTLWAGAEHWGGVLTVESNGTERSFRWDVWDPKANWTDGHKRLDSYVTTLVRMVVTSPGYRAMPRPKGMSID